MQDWPPLIINANRSPLLIWRDRLMTIGLWAILAWLFISQSVVFWRRIAEIMYPSDPDQVVAWEFRILPFLAVAFILVMRLCFWAVLSKRDYNRVTRDQPPPSLDPAVESSRTGLTYPEILAGRQLPVAVVHIDAAGHYRLEAPAPPDRS